MRVHHRIPSIFNLSMVDVLCCALGCVILLWLINLREAKQKSIAAGKTGELLAAARADLQKLGVRLTSTEARADAAETAARAAGRDREQLNRDLQAVRSSLADLTRSQGALRAERAALAERLTKKNREQEEAAKEMAASRQRLAALDVLVREKEM